MPRYKLSDIAGLELGKSRLIELEGEKYLIYHLSDGFHATSHKCTHLFKSLQKGLIVSDKTVRCPLHRAEFDIRTGEVAQWACFPPGIQVLNAVRSEKALDSYKVSEEDGQFYLEV